MTTHPHTSSTNWQREFRLTPEWQEKLPSIWQLHQGFALKIIQHIDPHSRYGERTFRLAHERLSTNEHTHKTHPSNDAPAHQRNLVFLTPHFSSVTQLEAHARQNSVNILQAHIHSHSTNDLDHLNRAI